MNTNWKKANEVVCEELGGGALLVELKTGRRWALNAAATLNEDAMLGEPQFEMLRGRIFSIRDGIVSKMGEYRSEFRRRCGGR